MIRLPAFRDGDKVYEHHLAAACLELESCGLADAAVFDARLHKVGCAGQPFNLPAQRSDPPPDLPVPLTASPA